LDGPKKFIHITRNVAGLNSPILPVSSNKRSQSLMAKNSDAIDTQGRMLRFRSGLGWKIATFR
jgi:hypothetical protein